MADKQDVIEQATIAAGAAVGKYGGGATGLTALGLWLSDNQTMIYLFVAVGGLVVSAIGVWIQARATKRREAREEHVYRLRVEKLQSGEDE